MLIDQKSAAKSKKIFVGFRVGRPGFLLGGVRPKSYRNLKSKNLIKNNCDSQKHPPKI